MTNDDKPPITSQDFLTGQVLVAMPNMGDPRFEKAVILMCMHDVDHAMGVIVNKPLENLELSAMLERLDIEPAEHASEEPVFFGGPVQTERGIVIHTLDYQSENTIVITDDIGITATKDILSDIAGEDTSSPKPRRYLLAVGHAGWGSGQLEQEIAMNAWLHCDVDEAIVFQGAVEPTWNRALQKLGVTTAMFSPEWASSRRDDQPLN